MLGELEDDDEVLEVVAMLGNPRTLEDLVGNPALVFGGFMTFRASDLCPLMAKL